MAGEMLATLCITKLQGDARPSLYPRTACCRVAAGAMGRGRRRLASGVRAVGIGDKDGHARVLVSR